MARVSVDNIITAIDIGTTKICVLIAQRSEHSLVDIIGVGKAPSHGLEKGVVVDVAQTVQSIKAALKEAELMAGISVDSAVIGISGGHIQSTNSHGVVAVKRPDIRSADMERALESARAVPIPEGMQILHVLPQYFVIDTASRVLDPRGMHGVRLEVEAHIIMGAVSSVRNLVTCCELAGVQVADIVLEQLASADAVLTDDERQLGVGVLDIGGGTSDFAVYHNGSIRHTYVVPVAGNHFTNDLAIGLRLKIDEAERIKKRYGIALSSQLSKDSLIEAELAQGDEKGLLYSSDLVAILEPRAREVFAMVRREIQTRHLAPFMSMGLVLTGGGSLLKGMKDLAEEMLQMPVRIGVPRVPVSMPDMLSSPLYATSYGLLIYSLEQKTEIQRGKTEGPMVKQVFNRMKSWVLDFF